MNPKSLDLNRWQSLIDLFKMVPHDDGPCAYRCEGTHLQTGWECGMFYVDGHMFLSFSPLHHGKIVMLAVRDDFLRWVRMRKEEAKDVPEQMELF